MARAVPIPWADLRRVTPGELLALETTVDALEAESNLRAICNAAAAFGGGKEASRYVRGLHERLEAYQRAVRASDPDVNRKVKESQARSVQAFAAYLSAREGAVPTCQPE